MKKLLVILSIVIGMVVRGAEPEWQWPLKGRSAGDDILYSPQQHIGGEHNFGNLFVGGEAGDTVVSPVEGKIASISIDYKRTLTYSISYRFDRIAPMSEQIAKIAASADKGIDGRYITGSISITMPDGRTLWLGGLILDGKFMTGEKISRGQYLGALHYSYRGVKQPSLSISVSDRNSRNDDPMSPFGLRSTFIPPTKQAVKKQLTGEEAMEDFTTILNVLREAYPSLDDVVTPEQLDAFEAETIDSLRGGISRDSLYRHLQRLHAIVHDSHFTLYPNEGDGRERTVLLPRIFYGWFGDSCIVTMAKKEHADMVGRRIARIDGITADSARRLYALRTGGYDAQVRSVIDERLAISSTSVTNDEYDRCIEFADGETRTFKGFRSMGGPADFTDTFIGYLRVNKWYPDSYRLRMIDDSTAYIGISTFDLNEVQTGEIVHYIDSIALVPNLIVDVRNNGGGDIEVLSRILSCLLDAPSRSKGAVQWVKKRGGFSSFAGCCLNYTDEVDIFSEYMPVEGRTGFFSTADSQTIQPDSAVHYRGRIYVLTNASSCSAATAFPGEIVRNHRGVVVGRETATAYHYMTALKFADIRLPNSGFQLRVPLVKVIADTTTNERIPYGRGVLPDYPVDITFEEAYLRPDSILDYTLKLIAEGKYFTGDDPFLANNTPAAGSPRTVWYIVCGCIIAAAAAGRIAYRRKTNRQ